MHYSVDCITDALCIVGESPLWREETQTLFMVDIHGKRIRSIDWETGSIIDRVMKQQTGALLLEKDGGLLACMEDGIYRISEEGSATSLFAPLKLAGPRFNDVKVGPDGRIYGGYSDKKSVQREILPRTSALYSIGKHKPKHYAQSRL